MIDPDDERLERRLLILAPVGKDANITAAVLSESDIEHDICPDMKTLTEALEAGAGAVLLTEETLLHGNEQEALIRVLNWQSPWSDIPVLILTQPGADSGTASQALKTLGNVTLLERPMRVSTLVSAVRTALRARQRQYDLRDRMEALRHSEASLSEFFENANVGLHWAGPDGIILRVNQAELDMLGYAREEYVGQNLAQFYEDPAVFAGIMKRLKGGEKLQGCPARLRAKDGSIRDVMINSSVLWDQGKFVHTRCFTLDVTQRKRAEEKLRKSQEQLELALGGARASIWGWDVQTNRLDEWTPEYRELYGFTGQEPAVYDTWLARVHPDDRGHLVERTKKMLETPGDDLWDEEFRIVHPQAGVRWVAGLGRCFRDETGRALRVAGVNLDISARKAAEAALRDSQNRLAAELEAMSHLHALSGRLMAAPDWQTALEEVLDASIQISGADFGCVQLYNPQTQTLDLKTHRGLSPEFVDYFRSVGADSCTPYVNAMRGQRVIIEDVEQEPECERYRSVIESTGFRAVQITPLMRPRGQLLGVLATHFRQPHRPSDRELRYIDLYVGQVVSFWERLSAEETLQRSATRSRLLWEAASVLLTTEEPDAMISTMFAKIAPHFALDTFLNFMVDDTGEALRLQSCIGISEEEARQITRLEFGQAVCGNVALQRQPIVATHIQQSDDPKVELAKRYGFRAYACTPLISHGQLLGTLAFGSRRRDTFDPDELDFLKTICHYVTVAYERMRLIRQLRESHRRKDEFLATLAHELRNPLAPINNALHILRLESNDVPATAHVCEMIQRQTNYLVRLVDDLMEVSRITRGKIELHRERVELASIMRNAVETSQPLIDAAGHQLHLSIPPEPLFLQGDLVRLAQVFANLLNNAAKYTEAGGQIWFSASRQQNEIVVSVRDSGIGIPADMLPRVFEIFSQVDRSPSRAHGGLGIGLALVRSLVEMHGGKVEARSAGKGEGSEFIVHLPMAEEARRAPETRRPESKPSSVLSARRVLVVDDNRDAADSLGTLLKILGAEVKVVYDGPSAIEAARTYRPAVMLLDIGMPGMDGYEVARRIHQQPESRDVTLIALTGWSQEEDRRQSQSAGFDHHLVKPADVSALQALLVSLEGSSQTKH